MAKNKRQISIDDAKSIAYDLFMNTTKSQKEICLIAKVTEATFTNWKQKYDWEIHKQAFSLTANNIIANLMQKAYNLSTEDKFNADALLKVVKAIESLSDKKVTVSNIINVFKEFTTWAFDENPEVAKQINTLQKGFVDYKINAK